MKRVVVFSLLAMIGIYGCSTIPPSKRQYVVFFQTDTATLLDGGSTVVAEVAHIAQTMKSSIVEVEGQADGGTAHDATLADSRSLAVIKALNAAGVDQTRIVKLPSIPAPGQDGLVAHKVIITLTSK